jgi:hypothetical protein
MWLSVQGIVAEKLLDLWSGLYPGMLAMVAACTVITLFSSQATGSPCSASRRISAWDC